MKTFIINQEQVNAFANYIAKQPYDQVFRLVAVLQSLPPVEESEPSKADKPKK